MPNAAKTFRLHDTPATPSRGNAAQRGYDHRWRRASKAWLALPENLLCIDCTAEGREGLAEVVDHQIPHRGDMELFWDESNWRPRCKRHHDRKTARGE